MEELQRIGDLWNKAINVPDASNDIYQFHRMKLVGQHAAELKRLINNLFQQSKRNIFELHLHLVENSVDYKDKKKFSNALFITETFCDWYAACERERKKLKEEHFMDECSTCCICKSNEALNLRAFDVATRYHLNLFSKFYEIYKFNEFNHLVEKSALERLASYHFSEQAMLLGLLQIQDKWDVKKVLIVEFFTLIKFL
jgi:hypothetical protein